MLRVFVTSGRWAIVPAVSLTAAWAVATHLPDPRRVGIDVGVHDWLAHGAGYAVMAVFWFFTASSYLRMGTLPTAGLVWIGMAVFGAVDECTQPYVGRAAQISDWASDVTGAATGVVFAAGVLQWVRGFRPDPSGKQQVLHEHHDGVHVAEHHPQRHHPQNDADDDQAGAYCGRQE